MSSGTDDLFYSMWVGKNDLKNSYLRNAIYLRSETAEIKCLCRDQRKFCFSGRRLPQAGGVVANDA